MRFVTVAELAAMLGAFLVGDAVLLASLAPSSGNWPAPLMNHSLNIHFSSLLESSR